MTIFSSCLRTWSSTRSFPLTTNVIREKLGFSVAPTARLSMLKAREANIREMWARTPGWFMTSAERTCRIKSFQHADLDGCGARPPRKAQFRGAAEASQPNGLKRLARDAFRHDGVLSSHKMNWFRHAFALDPPGPADRPTRNGRSSSGSVESWFGGG